MTTENQTTKFNSLPFDELDLMRIARRERARYVRESFRSLADTVRGRRG